MITDEPDTEDLKVRHELRYTRLPEGLSDGLYYKNLLWDSQRRYYENYMFRDLKTVPVTLASQIAILESDCEDTEQMMAGAVRFVSSLAGVDGLVLMNPDLSLRGFGTIICSENDVAHVRLISSSGSIGTEVSIESFGTRHGSMIRYCDSHPGSLGLVISQDGDIRAITRIDDGCVVFHNVRVHDLDNHSPILPQKRRKSLSKGSHRRNAGRLA